MQTAVLLSCHGTVERLEDLPAFVTNIRRGRPAPDDVVAEVRRRFEAIGGSPLMRITREQAAALEARLGVPVRAAGRLWPPYPKEIVAELAALGASRVVSLPLAPQSVDVYHAVVREAVAAHGGVELTCVPSWGLEPALIDAFVESVDEGLARFDPGERAGVVVVLTAHSLPRRVIDAGDAYDRQFREMAAHVEARLAERGQPVRKGFQSQGMGGHEAWLGPSLPEMLAEIAASGGTRVLVAPIGFVADHVETLYDLDIEAHELARAAGVVRLERAPAMNARPRFIDALEAVARRAIGAG